jgi:hypothetical protein
MKDLIALILMSVLFGNAVLEARVCTSARSGSQRGPNETGVKQKVGAMPAQSLVKVRLGNKEKVRGRLGPVTDEGFALEVDQGNKVLDRMLTFQEVKSVEIVRPSSRSAKIAAWVVFGAGAGVVVVFLALYFHGNGG